MLKGFRPLGLFHDIHSEKYNFPALFFGHARPSLTCSYQIYIYHKKIGLILYCHLHGFVYENNFYLVIHL
jgi:hypothetical protein